jgi:serine protease AprX
VPVTTPNHPAMNARRTAVSWGVAAVTAAAALAAPAVPAATGSGSPAGADVRIAPALADAVAAGAAPAVLTWDRTEADHAAVAAHLSRAGLRAQLLDALPMALVCAGGAGDLRTLAAAPGAVSVWGEERLRTAGRVSTEPVPAVLSTATSAGLGVTGRGLGLGVVDSGVDGRQAAFAGRMRSNVRVLVSHREILGPGDPPPCQDVLSVELADSELTSGHGTHLAGVAAGNPAATGGRYAPLATGAQVVGVGVDDTVTPDTDVKDDTRLSLFGALAGLNYVLSVGLDVASPVKAVIGGWVGDGLHNPYHPLNLAVRDLSDFGISVVLPAGNEGPAASDCSAAATCRFNPYAAGGQAIGVAAATAASPRGLTPFSSRGDRETRESEGIEVRYEPVVTAVGEAVVGPRRLGSANVVTPPLHGGGGVPTSPSTDTQHVAMTGTSVAAAQVAGAVLLMQEAAREATGCYLPSATVRRLLASTATPMAASRTEAGGGLLDVAAAVAAARVEPAIVRRDPLTCPGKTTGGGS